MLLMVDDDGRKALNQLLDIALRQGGLGNLQGVVDIIKSAQDIKPQPVNTDTVPDDSKGLQGKPC